MEKIDWGKAPEGATHYLPETVPWHPCWVKREAENWYTMIDDGHDSRWDIDRDFEEAKHHIIPRPAQWTGEGLPPVGTVCQLRTVRDPDAVFDRWGKAEILYSSKGAVVWRWQGHSSEFGAEWSDVKFRPIRTPDQIAAEKQEKAIDQIMANYKFTTGSCTHKLFQHQAERLHDAGFRKVTP